MLISDGLLVAVVFGAMRYPRIWYDSKVPHCDSHYCSHLWLRIVTAKSGVNAACLKKLQKSGFNWLFLKLFVTFFLLFMTFFHFLRRTVFILRKPSHYRHSLKAVTINTVVTLWLCLFLYFTSVLNRLSYLASFASGEVTSLY
jgi:hypothetical protein